LYKNVCFHDFITVLSLYEKTYAILELTKTVLFQFVIIFAHFAMDKNT